MYIHEAYTILESQESSLDELLEAYEVICTEKGYLLAIATRNLETESNMELEPKIWKLILTIAALKSKIESKIN